MKRVHSERGNRLKRIVDLAVGSPLLGVLGLLRRRRPLPQEVGTLGLCMFGVIGDTLLAASIVPDLKRAFPFARLVAFISKANRGVISLLDGFDEVVVVPITRPLAAAAIMRRYSLDVLIDIGQWARISALISRVARARFTVGFKTPRQWRHFAFDAVVEHSPVLHEIDNFRSLLRGVGLTGHSLPRFEPALLADIRTPSEHSYVVLHPWASGYRSELREWPEDRWTQLANLVLEWGHDIVVTGGPEDAGRAAALVDRIGGGARVSSLAGKTSLRDTAVVLGRAAAVVSVNTGIMHLAALLGAPVVALHGPTNANRWGPVGSTAAVVGPGPESGGGFLNLGFEYPRFPPDCMGQISVMAVAQPLKSKLDSIPPTAVRRGEQRVHAAGV